MPRALVSVFDKTGVLDLCKGLAEEGWDIVSTGGTARLLKEEGVAVLPIEEVTGFPECLDGRVKTLHPRIHGGILAIRSLDSHMKQLEDLSVSPVDMVVNNLYPFRETLEKPGSTHAEIIENIDIGGPSMIRAAAKNYQDVAILVDPADYEEVLESIKAEGATSYALNERLAAKAFMHTAHYDALIAQYFLEKTENTEPELLTLTFERQQSLRYGENPHQKASFYKEIFDKKGSLVEAKQLHGKELSFNNIHDTNGALEILKEYGDEIPTVVAVKHANPCGIAQADSLSEAFFKANAADPISIFGGILAMNRELDLATAEQISKVFIEVVVAPSFTEEALACLTKKKNIRVLLMPTITEKNPGKDYKRVLGGLLIQDRDAKLMDGDPSVATKRTPTEKEWKDLDFAWRAVKNSKSNGISLAKEAVLVANGPGQVSRIWALENAIKQANVSLEGASLASDAFFPFEDCVEAAHAAGITAIIQPGGSKNDQRSIDKANEYGMTMVFTGVRHFRH
jgi:phosphoribosylaminoimidazolecarboxamide formyltransferase/IMP cyclohydrolase